MDLKGVRAFWTGCTQSLRGVVRTSLLGDLVTRRYGRHNFDGVCHTWVLMLIVLRTSCDPYRNPVVLGPIP